MTLRIDLIVQSRPILLTKNEADLVVTATGREADAVTAVLRSFLDYDAVAAAAEEMAASIVEITRRARA